jgi:uncharacterized membrane protein YdfJ with MMPL/SSD domain
MDHAAVAPDSCSGHVAAIMFGVFGSFALLPDRMLAQTGFAMAVAVLLDAIIIRCLIVPAVLRLLGVRAWWLPAVLNRRIPTLHVEGSRDANATPSRPPSRRPSNSDALGLNVQRVLLADRSTA